MKLYSPYLLLVFHKWNNFRQPARLRPFFSRAASKKWTVTRGCCICDLFVGFQAAFSCSRKISIQMWRVGSFQMKGGKEVEIIWRPYSFRLLIYEVSCSWLILKAVLVNDLWSFVTMGTLKIGARKFQVACFDRRLRWSLAKSFFFIG